MTPHENMLLRRGTIKKMKKKQQEMIFNAQIKIPHTTKQSESKEQIFNNLQLANEQKRSIDNQTTISIDATQDIANMNSRLMP